jgi:two-component system, cell cycle response regulator DivK
MKDKFLQGWDVVVVEDEVDSLDIAEILLTSYGANVYTAADGAAGLEVIQKVRPKMVISDLSMPKLDGWGLLEKLKQNRATMDIPVIALTAHAMAGDRDKAIAAGFHNYLTKPLTVETFLQDMIRIVADIEMLEPFEVGQNSGESVNGSKDSAG